MVPSHWSLSPVVTRYFFMLLFNPDNYQPLTSTKLTSTSLNHSDSILTHIWTSLSIDDKQGFRGEQRPAMMVNQGLITDHES